MADHPLGFVARDKDYRLSLGLPGIILTLNFVAWENASPGKSLFAVLTRCKVPGVAQTHLANQMFASNSDCVASVTWFLRFHRQTNGEKYF